MLAYLAGGYVLLYTGWKSGRIATAALRSEIMAESLLARLPPRQNRFSGYTDWANAVLPLITEHPSTYVHIQYIMIWKSDGTVVFLAQREKTGLVLDSSFIGHTLNPSHWPTPTGGAMTVRKVRSVPWDTNPNTYVDTTVPVFWHGLSAYLSMGYPTSAFFDRFFHDRKKALLLLGLTGIAGELALGLLAFFIKRRLDANRAHYARTLLARTSLLSERGMLASVLAHEVRSPLTALGFNLHFLRNLESPNRDTSQQAALIESCEREVRRLDLMLDDFLTRTQIVGGGRDASLNTVVTEALDFLRPALASQDIRFITHLDPADPHVPVSSDELRQVLLNLCTNAQEAMPRSGTLAISTMAEAENAVLLVRDSGKGIPPEVQERMFDPFFSTKPHGSGLGLALVRRVVTGAGGSVFFESELKHGTTFRIVMPRAILPTAAPTAPAVDQQVRGHRMAQQGPLTGTQQPEKG